VYVCESLIVYIYARIIARVRAGVVHASGINISLFETTRKCLNTWFNRAYLQECVHAMLAIKRSSPV
jgi:hypothetical protein